MEHLLLSVHVIGGIVFVGGSAVATSLFPRFAPVAVTVSEGPTSEIPPSARRSPDERNPAVAALLHRITRVYAVAALVVPLAGILLALLQSRMGEAWLTVSMLLTAAAGILLAAQIHPRQRDALRRPGDRRALRTLSMLSGFYNLLWAIVVVLMVVRPGEGG